MDVLLEIANGKYESMLVGMLRTALPGNGLWYTVLYLMGSGSVEVRERALRLLILTLSTSSGKVSKLSFSSKSFFLSIEFVISLILAKQQALRSAMDSK